MKKKSLIFVLLICLIMPCCLFFAGCKDDDESVLQLNTKYYAEDSPTYVYYYIFTSNTEGYLYSKEVSSQNERITNFIYEYTSEDAICYICPDTDGGTFYSITLLVSKNFIVTETGTIYVAENYLIANNLPYVK